MKVIELIPTGRMNAKSRHQLRAELGCDDTSMRRVISSISRTIPIINTGSGYFIPDWDDAGDRIEAKRYATDLKAKAFSELERARIIEGNLAPYNGGNIYRSARLLKGYTQKELSEMTGIGIPDISKIENNRILPTTEQHRAIERACGVKM